MAKFLKITFLWLAFCSSASANIQVITDGRSLVVSCQQALVAVDKGLDHIEPDNQNNAFICFSYLAGLIGGARYTESLSELRYAQATSKVEDPKQLSPFRKSCIDWNTQYQKAARIVLNFARQHRDELGEPAHKLALRALQNAFPCR